MRQVVEERGIAAEIETQCRSSAGSLVMLLQYKEWADRIAFEAVMSIPEEEAIKSLNHVYVIDDIFRHHLTGRMHVTRCGIRSTHPQSANSGFRFRRWTVGTSIK